MHCFVYQVCVVLGEVGGCASCVVGWGGWVSIMQYVLHTCAVLPPQPCPVENNVMQQHTTATTHHHTPVTGHLQHYWGSAQSTQYWSTQSTHPTNRSDIIKYNQLLINTMKHVGPWLKKTWADWCASVLEEFHRGAAAHGVIPHDAHGGVLPDDAHGSIAIHTRGGIAIQLSVSLAQHSRRRHTSDHPTYVYVCLCVCVYGVYIVMCVYVWMCIVMCVCLVASGVHGVHIVMGVWVCHIHTTTHPTTPPPPQVADTR